MKINDNLYYTNIDIKKKQKTIIENNKILKKEINQQKLNKNEISNIDKIKSEINNGTYKVDLNLLSKKIADDLLK